MTLRDDGFCHTRNDVHAPCLAGLLLLGNRQTFAAVSHFAPWDLEDFDTRIAIHPKLADTSLEHTKNIKRKAEDALSHLGDFDSAFWLDASCSPIDHSSSAACIGFDPSAESPAKR